MTEVAQFSLENLLPRKHVAFTVNFNFHQYKLKICETNSNLPIVLHPGKVPSHATILYGQNEAFCLKKFFVLKKNSKQVE